ncbi:MAG: hypothetical protein FWK04_12710 [Nostoc sp. GBBB01]|uniref:Uncharacterized protein n=1 Tax=Nostoc punctiforme FACHB-252 TaxID=1357509 RepID=A0ABR8H3X1_NOSPU|nr:hypothetical protein [Nostoc punctiforme]MBD2609935.1 hypothetical protein [Nostoc punctiforme FACHB-252]MBL1199916.1 hypothetical protein [Nostoc sp. GBBB01]
MNLAPTISVLLLTTSLAAISLQLGTASSAQKISNLSQASSTLPLVKSVGLSPDMDVPWSKPVRILDPFEGELLGVFDRNYLGGYLYRDGSKQVISLWTPESIRLLVTVNSGQVKSSFYTAGSLYPRPDYLKFVTTQKVDKLSIKVREKIFQLEGSIGTFVVNQELATALKNAPDENLDIRLVLEGGQTVDSEIGKGTVKAWRSIY